MVFGDPSINKHDIWRPFNQYTWYLAPLQSIPMVVGAPSINTHGSWRPFNQYTW